MNTPAKPAVTSSDAGMSPRSSRFRALIACPHVPASPEAPRGGRDPGGGDPGARDPYGRDPNHGEIFPCSRSITSEVASDCERRLLFKSWVRRGAGMVAAGTPET